MKVYINGGPYDGQIFDGVPEGQMSIQFALVSPAYLHCERHPDDEVVLVEPVPVERVVRYICHRYVSCTDTFVFKGAHGYDNYFLADAEDKVKTGLYNKAPLVHRYQIRHSYQPYPLNNDYTELVVEGIATWSEVTWDDL